MSSIPQPVFIKPYRAIVGMSTTGSSSGSGGGTAPITSNSSLQVTTIQADAVISEDADDELIITEQPVEQGAVISDHAYSLPTKLSLEYAWSLGSPQNAAQDSSFLKSLYQQLLGLKVSRTPCTVYTGKRQYTNMLIVRVRQKTDKLNENCLTVGVDLQEVLVATTSIVPVAQASQQQYPSQTSPTVNQGSQSLQPGTNFNTGAAPQ